MKQVRGEARQSGGATSAASPNLYRGKEDTVEETLRGRVETAMAKIEAVACALAIADGVDPQHDQAGPNERWYPVWHDYREMARAAIDAMSRSQSTVTEEMIEAARDADGLDPIEALTSDAAEAEGIKAMCEGGSSYGERLIRRAIKQGNLSLSGDALSKVSPLGR